jgi:hypothetical protein
LRRFFQKAAAFSYPKSRSFDRRGDMVTVDTISLLREKGHALAPRPNTGLEFQSNKIARLTAKFSHELSAIS